MAEEAGLVTSADDMIGSVSPELAEAPTLDAAPDTTASETLEDPGSPEAEPEAAEELPVEDPEGETPEGQEEQDAQPPQEPQQPGEELPEGVRKGKLTNGKDAYFLEPNRYEKFHGAYKTLREFENVIGEPVTPEVLKLHADAFDAQERLYNDILSGDANAQRNVLGFFIDQARDAMANGAVAGDPVATLADSFYGLMRDLREQHPQAWEKLRTPAAHDLIDEMYGEAAATNNKALWYAAQHFDKTIGRKYKADTDMAAMANGEASELARIKAENARLQAQVSGKQANVQAERQRMWQAQTNQAIASAVLDKAIKPALADEQAAWAKFPGPFNDLIVGRLKSKVDETIDQDVRFKERIGRLVSEARRAVSEQRRVEVARLIESAYENRARLAVEAHKRAIVTEAAQLFKEQNAATHQRRQAAANVRGPKGSSSPVPKGIVPPSLANPPAESGFATADELYSSALRRVLA